jgi:hypothetical protein
MALLSRLCAAFALACASCAGSEELGRVDVWLSACRGAEPCRSSAEHEHFAVQAFIDPSVSRYAPNGLYAYFELHRANGQRALVELDVPTAVPADATAVSYRELDGDRLVFEASEVHGRIVMPELLAAVGARSCGCEQGSFALHFVSAARDGVLGSDDDDVRELTVGYLGRTDELCSSQLQLSDELDLQVNVRRCAELLPSPPPPPSEPTPRSPAPRSSACGRYDCDPAYDDDYYDSNYAAGGCGSYADSGCEGSSSSDDGCGESRSESSGGCSDDDPDNDDGGCEGDTRNDSSNCTIARVPTRGGVSGLGTAAPWLLVCSWQLVRAARARKAALRTR